MLLVIATTTVEVYRSSIVCLRCFRILTILYYLNDVKEGGETAFLVADNNTLDVKVRFT